MNKGVKIFSITITILLLAGSNMISYKHYNEYNKCKSKLEESNNKIALYKSEIEELNIANSTNNNETVSKVAGDFINKYFNFNSREHDKIYDDIKPYCTEELVKSLSPADYFESDFEYESSIANLIMYYSKVDSTSASILATADQTITAKGASTSSTPTLLELEVIYKENKWLVNSIKIHTLKNQIN